MAPSLFLLATGLLFMVLSVTFPSARVSSDAMFVGGVIMVSTAYVLKHWECLKK